MSVCINALGQARVRTLGQRTPFGVSGGETLGLGSSSLATNKL